MPDKPSASTPTSNSPSSVTTQWPTIDVKPIGELLSEIGVEIPQSSNGREHAMLVALRMAWPLVWRYNSSSKRTAVLNRLETEANRLLQPASPGQIVTRIEAMLSHYYRADDADEVHGLALSDWVTMLAAAPLWSINAACIAWMANTDTRKRKPVPGDIAELLIHKSPHAAPRKHPDVPSGPVKIGAVVSRLLPQP